MMVMMTETSCRMRYTTYPAIEHRGESEMLASDPSSESEGVDEMMLPESEDEDEAARRHHPFDNADGEDAAHVPERPRNPVGLFLRALDESDSDSDGGEFGGPNEQLVALWHGMSQAHLYGDVPTWNNVPNLPDTDSKRGISPQGMRVYVVGKGNPLHTHYIHPLKFPDEDHTYNCIVQFIESTKAYRYIAFELIDPIMESGDPEEHKRLGSQV